jgi:hypothetical protein
MLWMLVSAWVAKSSIICSASARIAIFRYQAVREKACPVDRGVLGDPEPIILSLSV